MENEWEDEWKIFRNISMTYIVRCRYFAMKYENTTLLTLAFRKELLESRKCEKPTYFVCGIYSHFSNFNCKE